jgi:hypothetical protein
VATSPSAANIAILSNRRETTGVWRVGHSLLFS